ncbi:MAG TPA: BamA/TamA family outer membrane protein [Thermoanaerobaculaceae bacterium]|nr:BamA/TamA family outer membrane protein [Thermoanaerobaculaceae bacterium]HRS16541.1 BamA/TamA family outer membrane protein [Thermoanaerobaculaceae bacterium]
MAAPLLTAGWLCASLVWGQTPIREVRLEAPGAADPSYLRKVLAIEPGAPLSRTEIRTGTQALLATGEVEDVTVEVESTESGAILKFAVQVASRISQVRIEGLPRRYRVELPQQLGLQVGAPLEVNRFVRALQRAEEQLRLRGYPEARLDPELDARPAAGTVAVTVRATLGTARTLGMIRAPGSDLGAEPLLKICGLGPGDRLGEGRLEGARRRLEQHLRAAGFWEAEVDAPRLQRTGVLDDLVLQVRKGPHYRLVLTGMRDPAELGRDTLRFLGGDEPFAESSLDLIARDVRIALQQRGFLDARVTAGLAAEKDERVLHLDVRRGERQRIAEVRFPGASALGPEQLRKRVGARKGRPWRWGGEPVDETTLAEDVLSVLGTYQAAGFAEAVVGTARIVPGAGGWTIEFPVEEGRRHEVRELAVEGWPSDLEMPGIGLATGSAWSQLAEDGARNALRAALAEAGYLDARVETRHACEEGQCDVQLEVLPGERSVVGRVVVAGLRRTSRTVVDRVAGLESGQVLGPQRQLEIQRRLLGLGIFGSVALSPIPGQVGGARRGVVLALTEGATRATAFGLGWDTERDFQVSAQWSELNLFGTGRALSVEGRYSSRELRAQLTYREPAMLGLLGVPAAVSVYRTEERATTYELLRRGLWAEVGDRLRKPRRALLRYEYQIVDPDAPPEVLSRLEREKQRARIASLAPTLEWDTRNDIFLPTRGVLASLQLQSSFPVFEADALFDKLTASLSGYVPFAGGVMAGAVRSGFIRPRTGNDPPAPDPIDVPVSVRFFAGGRISHRAFATDRLGIRGQTLTDSGEPIGGGGLLLANLEWRVPLWGPVGASLFVDGGNVWREYDDIEARQIRWGGGLGLRVETPVGPLRLEYGWKFRREPFAGGRMESPGQLYISFGNPF